MKTILRLVVPALLVLLASCRTAQPSAPPDVGSSASVPEADGETRVVLCNQLLEIIWRWDHPEESWRGTPCPGVDDEQVMTSLRERFDKFCTDVSIVLPGGKPVTMLADWRNVYVYLPAQSRARKRFLELNWALGEEETPRQFAIDLTVFEVPERLARRWGLDGLPAAAATPPLLDQGLPLAMEPEDYALLQSLILAQPGTRLFATASVLTPSGTTASVRHVRMEPTPSSGEPAVGQAPQLEYGAADAVAPGIVFEATPYDPGCRRWLVPVEVYFQATGASSWGGSGAKADERTRVVPEVQFRTKAACGMGQTILLGSTYRSGEACASLPGQDRRSILLAFLTLRWSPALPDYPSPEDFVSPTGQLVFFDIPGLASMSAPSTRGEKIDWGDDDGDDDDDDDDSLSAKTPTERVKGFLSSACSVPFDPNGKFFCTNRTIVCFDSVETNGKIARIFSEVGCHGPLPLLCRATAVQFSPELWLKLMRGSGKDLDPAHRVLWYNSRDVFQEIEQDTGSRILASAAITTLSGKSTQVHDVVRLTGPEAYRCVPAGKRQVWNPVVASRNVGVNFEVTLELSPDLYHTDLQLRPEYTSFLGWQRPGTSPVLPQYRSYTVEDSLSMEYGTCLLLGGSGGGTPNEPITVWLIGLRRIAW